MCRVFAPYAGLQPAGAGYLSEQGTPIGQGRNMALFNVPYNALLYWMCRGGNALGVKL